jgi:hypothetical protein
MNDHSHTTEDPAVIFPDWVQPPFRQCKGRLKDETRFMHLAWSGLEKIRHLPELMKILSKSVLTDDAKSHGPTEEDVKRADSDAEWVDAEAKQGFPLLHSHSAVSLWSILETFVEDLAVTWFQNKPEAWEIEILEKIRVPVGTYERLQGEDKARHVVSEIYRQLGADLKTGVGGLGAVLAQLKLTPQVGDNVKKALHELCQVRNAIVHRGTRADQRLIEACPYLPWKSGDSIKISHALFGWYHAAAERYRDRTLNQVLIVFGSVGCQCPGLDEIGSRPAG